MTDVEALMTKIIRVSRALTITMYSSGIIGLVILGSSYRLDSETLCWATFFFAVFAIMAGKSVYARVSYDMDQRAKLRS